MRRFVISADQINGNQVSFGPAESRHLGRVLRLRLGDIVLAADGTGQQYTVRLETIRPFATGIILEKGRGTAESPLDLTLIQGVPKGDKMETIVRVATELGVTRVMAAITARTVVSLDETRWRARARRWQRVAAEAAKQCGRAVIPEISPPRPLKSIVEAFDIPSLAICLWEGERRPLADTLTGIESRTLSVAVIVGPEGGLAPGEVQCARDRGWRVAGLGPRVLRTETAGPAVLAILQARYGDLLRADESSQK